MGICRSLHYARRVVGVYTQSSNYRSTKAIVKQWGCIPGPITLPSRFLIPPIIPTAIISCRIYAVCWITSMESSLSAKEILRPRTRCIPWNIPLCSDTILLGVWFKCLYVNPISLKSRVKSQEIPPSLHLCEKVATWLCYLRVFITSLQKLASWSYYLRISLLLCKKVAIWLWYLRVFIASLHKIDQHGLS